MCWKEKAEAAGKTADLEEDMKQLEGWISTRRTEIIKATNRP